MALKPAAYDPAANEYPKMVFPPGEKPGESNGKIVNNKEEETAYFDGLKKAPKADADPAPAEPAKEDDPKAADAPKSGKK